VPHTFSRQSHSLTKRVSFCTNYTSSPGTNLLIHTHYVSLIYTTIYHLHRETNLIGRLTLLIVITTGQILLISPALASIYTSPRIASIASLYHRARNQRSIFLTVLIGRTHWPTSRYTLYLHKYYLVGPSSAMLKAPFLPFVGSLPRLGLLPSFRLSFLHPLRELPRLGELPGKRFIWFRLFKYHILSTDGPFLYVAGRLNGVFKYNILYTLISFTQAYSGYSSVRDFFSLRIYRGEPTTPIVL